MKAVKSANETGTGNASTTSTQKVRETGTVKRVLMLLRGLVDHPDESAQSLAQRLDLPRSTVHRLLATLRANDFALTRPDGTFGPGLDLYRMAGKLGPQMPYSKFAEPRLQALSAEFHETSILTLLVRQQLKMYHAATGTPADPMRYNIGLNQMAPLLWGATGRVLLAYLTEVEIDQAIQGGELSPVKRFVPDKVEIDSALEGIRHDGYAITHSHRTANTVGIAAPFFDSEGKIVGNLAFLIPEFRWNLASQDAVVAALKNAAAEMSRELGRATDVAGKTFNSGPEG